MSASSNSRRPREQSQSGRQPRRDAYEAPAGESAESGTPYEMQNAEQWPQAANGTRSARGAGAGAAASEYRQQQPYAASQTGIQTGSGRNASSGNNANADPAYQHYATYEHQQQEADPQHEPHYATPSYGSATKLNEADGYTNKETAYNQPNEPYYNNAADYNEYEFEKQPTAFDKFERFCCCCCPKTKMGRIICAVVTLLVLIVMAIILYFFLPRMPMNYVNYVYENVEGFKLQYTDSSQNINTATFAANFSMSVSIYNPNIYALNLDGLSLNVNINVNQSAVYNSLTSKTLISVVGAQGVQKVGPPPNPSTDPSYLGNMNPAIAFARTGTLNLPSHTNTTFNMTLQFSYTPDPQLGVLKDPAVLELANACGVTSRKSETRYMSLTYTAVASIGALKSLGFNPTTVSNGFFACPFNLTGDYASEIETKINNGESVAQALSEVFGW
ncbi:hypothetical protein BC830DRAFT_1119980 [Chytriomyces sp. MP71]|nr:hypothetical protein BC830DRAFT_1119980 [Chytriomyces sp. MP71]